MRKAPPLRRMADASKKKNFRALFDREYAGKCCGYYTVGNFMTLDPKELSEVTAMQLKNVINAEATEYQVKVWEKCFAALIKQFRKHPKYSNLYLIVEYSVPTKQLFAKKRTERKVCKRPDIILLERNTVFVLEFKETSKNTRYFSRYLKQTQGYCSRFNLHHKYARKMEVVGCLVFGRSRNYREIIEGIHCISPDKLPEILKEACPEPKKYFRINEWMDGFE